MKIGFGRHGRTALFASVALVLGASVGIGIDVLMSGAATPAPHSVGAGQYQVNANGQTYGSALGATTPPVLVRTYADSGAVGYVYFAQLFSASGGDVQTPQEALAWDARANQSISIPVYEVDGTTVIGTFTISGGVPTVVSSGGQ